MPYFPVDDQAAFHPKVIAAGNAAFGLWARAGSWSKNHATGGFIPTPVASSMGTRAEVRRLTDVGLWEEVLGGYLFHDWDHYGANKTGAEEEARRDARRAADRERQRRHRDKERDGHTVTDPVTLDPVPVPSPSVVERDQSPSVLETANAARTDSESVSPEVIAAASALHVDFEKVAARVNLQAGEPVPVAVVERIIRESVKRAKPRDGDRTGLVLASVKRDWSEWSRLVFRVAS